MIIQIRYLTLENRDWFSLPVNVWLKATTTISNKYGVNFIPEKQKTDNNNNSNNNNKSNNNSNNNNNNNNDNTNNSNHDDNKNKIRYRENDDFCWKLTMSESSFEFLWKLQNFFKIAHTIASFKGKAEGGR